MMSALRLMLVAILLACAVPMGAVHAGGSDAATTLSDLDRKALADALFNRKLETASGLIEGRSLDGVVFESGQTPLELLVSKPILEPGGPKPPPANEQTIRLLEKMLQAGADPSAADETGMTPLMALTAFGEDTPMGVRMAEALVEKGADVNHRAPSGQTALILAAFFGRSALAEGLMAQGADPSIRNGQGSTAADIARERGHLALAEKLSIR